jgi:RND family efflux transporter MFP subunit
MKGMTFLRFASGAACAFILAGCADEAPQSDAQASAVASAIVEPLQYDRARTRLEAVGTSRALRSIELYPATSGEVVAVRFEPGQRVSAGDVLVELDSREERLAVELAQVQLADAERLYDRYQRTGTSGAVTASALDAARTAVEAARIELDRARVALDFRTIEATFDGYVGITDVDRGDRINPDTMITTLDDRRALLVSFEVPESLIQELRTGDDVEIATWNSRAPQAFGEVVEIGSRIDPATRTFTARARVDNASDSLRPGMSFRVAMNLEGIAYPVIAETGVQWGADGAYIWRIVDGQARRVPVTIIQRQRGQVLVDADLGEGDLIVVEGIQRMREGIEVTYEPTGLADSMPGDSDPALPASSD